jgi:hypothetical protein
MKIMAMWVSLKTPDGDFSKPISGTNFNGRKGDWLTAAAAIVYY